MLVSCLCSPFNQSRSFSFICLFLTNEIQEERRNKEEIRNKEERKQQTSSEARGAKERASMYRIESCSAVCTITPLAERSYSHKNIN